MMLEIIYNNSFSDQEQNRDPDGERLIDIQVFEADQDFQFSIAVISDYECQKCRISKVYRKKHW